MPGRIGHAERHPGPVDEVEESELPAAGRSPVWVLTALFLGGFGISLWITIDKLIFGNPVGDRPLLLLGALLIIVGVQTFCTGLLADMILRRRMEEAIPYQITETIGPPVRQEQGIR